MMVKSNTRRYTALLASLLLCGAVSAPAFSAPVPHDHVGMVAEGLSWRAVAVKSGDWAQGSTWSTGVAPRSGENVRIPAGLTVTVRGSEPNPLAYLYVEGALLFDSNSNTKLTLDTMLIARTGRVAMGTQGSPVAAGRTAQIVIQASANAPLRVDLKTRGILSHGTFITNAATERKNMARLSGDARSGGKTLTFADNLDGWAVGDQIVVTGTYYRPPEDIRRVGIVAPPLENEVRTITAINGRSVTFDTALKYDHIRATPTVSIYVGNLTRPISISSASAAPVTNRGHTMFMEGSVVDINDTGFYQLGRTEKSKDVSGSNVLGLYSLHFHRNGYNEQKVNNSVIVGTPGWGLVNHSSNVAAVNNVVHDFAGSAYVTEAGDEMGSFIGNLASGGSNFPVAGKIAHREAISPDQRVRFMAGDMGKFAMGFWLVGPMVKVQNNVVANSLGTAYFYFGLGTHENGKITGFPLDMFPAGVNPRTFKYMNQFTGEKMGLVPDLPIASFNNNVAYGVFQGMRLRWSNDDGGFLLTREKTRFSDEVAEAIVESRNLKRIRGKVTNTTFWNVASGFAAGYSGAFDVDNITIVNGPEYQISCSRLCEEHGISLSNGMGGNDTKVTNARITNVNNAFDLGTKYDGSVTSTTVDGRAFRYP